MNSPENSPTDGRSSSATESDEHAPAARPGRRGRRWLELWWQPVGEPRSPGDDGTERHWRVPELHVTSHRAAQIVSIAIAIGVAVGCVFWAIEAADRFDVPTLVCAGCAPPEWFRWMQLFGAIAGIAMAIVQIVYLVNFAVRGIVWRRWRGVGIAFGSLAAAWTAMWWIDHLWI